MEQGTGRVPKPLRAVARRARVWPALLAVAALAALSAGCASDGGGGGFSFRRDAGGVVEELHLITVPVALKLDTVPGADGFAVKVFAGNAIQPKPFAITAGTLEILMYDGIVKKPAPAPPEPRKTWSFTAAELRRHALKTSIGVGYQFTLVWGEARPQSNRITVVARYRDRAGAVVQSAPTVIAVSE